MIRRFVALFVVCLSLSASAETWYYSTWSYSRFQNSGHYPFSSSGSTPDFVVALRQAYSILPISSGSGGSWYLLNGQGSGYLVCSNDTGTVYTYGGLRLDYQGFTSVSAPYLGSILSMLNQCLSVYHLPPDGFCSDVYTDGNQTRYVGFTTYSYLLDCYLRSPDFRADISSYLSSLDSNVSNILSRVLGIGGDTSFLAQVATATSADVLGVRTNVDAIARSVAPSDSALMSLIKYYISPKSLDFEVGLLPADWLAHFDRDTGLPKDEVGRQLALEAFRAGEVGSSYADFKRISGYTVSGSDFSYSQSTQGVVVDGETYTPSRFMSLSPLEREAIFARVSMAINTNDIRRIGQDVRDFAGRLLDPLSRENEEARQLAGSNITAAVSSALDSADGISVRVQEPLQVNVLNWPDGGFNVRFDDAAIHSLTGAFGDALRSVDTTLTRLMTDFNNWSGVDEGGRWLVVQDLLSSNLFEIVGALYSLTNGEHTISNIMYSVASSNLVNELESESDTFLSSLSSVESDVLSGFSPSSIAFAHTNFNFVQSGQFAPLAQLAATGDSLPQYVNIQFGNFGEFHFPTVAINVASVQPVLRGSRWVFRCAWVVLSVLFYVWLAKIAISVYRKIAQTMSLQSYYLVNG